MDRWKNALSVCQQATVVLGAVLAVLVFIGKPLAQNFITDTVEERIGQIEVQQRQLQAQFGEALDGQEELQNQLRALQSQQNSNNQDTDEILRLLKRQNGLP